MLSIKTSDDRILIKCTQCGAPIKFPEGDHSVQCPYCSIRLLLTSPNRVLKYYLNTELGERGIKFITEGYCKRNGMPLPSKVEAPELYYLPFWRFRGARYWLEIKSNYVEFEDGTKLEAEREIEVDSRPFDISFPGADIPLMRNTFLGVRSQTVELCPELPEGLQETAHIIKPDILLDQARDLAYEKAVNDGDKKEILFTEIIGETLTLIYFPVWVSQFTNRNGKYVLIIDGVSKRGISCEEGEFDGVNESDGFEGVTSAVIIPHHCPECGDDLPAGGNAVVFHCSNCGRGWYLEESGLVQREMLFTKTMDDSITYYPYWSFEATFNGKDAILTYQQAKQFFKHNLSLFIDDSSDSIFRFYIPAFSIRDPNKAWKLMANITRNQPDFKWRDYSMESPVAGSLPESEACEFGRVLWFYLIFCSAGGNINTVIRGSEIPDIHFRPGQIVYLPMKEDGIFLREQTTGFGVQKGGVS
ncbi:MAG: hypothetical protein GY855_16600 [candidate division Zixibacteria bacterium]|nr:hypothetical protein [candidate division Zixibacteria bacterium]